MITRDDYAKVLDFGLAKLVEPDVHEVGKTHTTEAADAVTLHQSMPGVVFDLNARLLDHSFKSYGDWPKNTSFLKSNLSW